MMEKPELSSIVPATESEASINVEQKQYGAYTLCDFEYMLHNRYIYSKKIVQIVQKNSTNCTISISSNNSESTSSEDRRISHNESNPEIMKDSIDVEPKRYGAYTLDDFEYMLRNRSSNSTNSKISNRSKNSESTSSEDEKISHEKIEVSSSNESNPEIMKDSIDLEPKRYGTYTLDDFEYMLHNRSSNSTNSTISNGHNKSESTSSEDGRISLEKIGVSYSNESNPELMKDSIDAEQMQYGVYTLSEVESRLRSFYG